MKKLPKTPLFANLVEQPRTSLLDILNQNLEIASRETYIDRKILIGEHDLGMSPEWGVGESLRKIATEVNDSFTEEKLTGVLLCYNDYFCVVMDGCEKNLIEFITRLKSIYGVQIRKVKMLAHFHNIYSRFVDDWIVISGKPPKLCENMPSEADIERTFKYVTFFVKKLFGLCTQIKQLNLQESELVGMVDFAGSALSVKQSITTLRPTPSLSRLAVSSSLGTQGKDNKLREFLPEYGLLQFLLDSPYLTDVYELTNKMTIVPNLDIAEDFCWPSGDLILFNEFYTKRSDPITDLPPR